MSYWKKPRKKRKKVFRPKDRPLLYNTTEQWRAEYLTEEWRLRRSQILMRDSYKCTQCGSTDHLCIHHKAYDPSLHVWEYMGEYLTTLCSNCHQILHDKLGDLTKLYAKKQLVRYAGNDEQNAIIAIMRMNADSINLF